VIEEIAKGLQAAGMNQGYLELGIAKGRCFNIISEYFGKSIAVDINQRALDYVEATEKHCTTTVDYLVNRVDCEAVLNLIFIDASHKFDAVLRDFQGAYKILSKNGIIIIHDTYSPSKVWDKHCEDAWKIIPYLKENNYEAVTLPFYYGLTMVRKP
jgi:predicted O-methyltransferase YrrM